MSRSDRKYLRRAILEVVENQLRDGSPPATRATLKRLMEEGYSRADAKRLIACVVSAEMFEIMKQEKPFDEHRFVSALNRLPELPE
jgi:hypothetical protein